MDWFRRNWPDLLIGIALVAVIAGIIATLITGGSFFPVGQNTRTSAPPAQTSPTQSAAPQAPGTPSTPANPSSSSNQPSATTQNANGGSSAAAGGGGEGGATASAPSSGVSVLPPNASSSGSESSGSAASGSASTGGSSSTAATSSSPSAPASAPASSAPATGSSQASTAANGPGAAAPYRVSVGAFSHKDYAQRQEEVFKKAGYPVFLASQGDLTIVLVGPYKSQSQAEQVASKIKSGGYGVDPVVYQFQGTSDQAPPAASSGGSSSGTASPSGPAPATAAATSSGPSGSSGSASATGGQRYLQVGAYGDAASAKPQRDRLENMGFAVRERTENGLVKLLIGPFGPDRLQQVESQLKAAGIDSFPR